MRSCPPIHRTDPGNGHFCLSVSSVLPSPDSRLHMKCRTVEQTDPSLDGQGAFPFGQNILQEENNYFNPTSSLHRVAIAWFQSINTSIFIINYTTGLVLERSSGQERCLGHAGAQNPQNMRVKTRFTRVRLTGFLLCFYSVALLPPLASLKNEHGLGISLSQACDQRYTCALICSPRKHYEVASISDEETEAQRDQISCLRSKSQQVVVLKFEESLTQNPPLNYVTSPPS